MGFSAGEDGVESPFEMVLRAFPQCEVRRYSKRTLIALSHGMEDQALEVAERGLVLATFQEGAFLQAEVGRYRRLAQRSERVVVFARGAEAVLAAGGVPDDAGGQIVPVELEEDEPLAREWHVAVASRNFMGLLLCREVPHQAHGAGVGTEGELDRPFEGVWTFDPEVVRYAAEAFLDRARRSAAEAVAGTRVPEADGSAASLANLQPLTARVVANLQRATRRELQRRREVERAYGQTVRLLGGAVEAKDHETGEHVSRVMALAARLAQRMGWDAAALRDLRFGAALHDLGKIGVPEAVLLKPGRLDDDELRLMRRHPETGARIVEGVPALRAAALAIRHHHERWDGGGYPDGLAGEEIPPLARVVALADVFDALRSDRPYREGWPLERVLALVREERGKAFQPALVDVLLALAEAGQL